MFVNTIVYYFNFYVVTLYGQMFVYHIHIQVGRWLCTISLYRMSQKWVFANPQHEDVHRDPQTNPQETAVYKYFIYIKAPKA